MSLWIFRISSRILMSQSNNIETNFVNPEFDLFVLLLRLSREGGSSAIDIGYDVF